MNVFHPHSIPTKYFYKSMIPFLLQLEVEKVREVLPDFICATTKFTISILSQSQCYHSLLKQV